MLCVRLDGRGVWGRMDTCICMARSFYYLPENITILLIGSTQYNIKHLHFKKKRERETPIQSRRILPSSKFHYKRSSVESSSSRVGSLSWRGGKAPATWNSSQRSPPVQTWTKTQLPPTQLQRQFPSPLPQHLECSWLQTPSSCQLWGWEEKGNERGGVKEGLSPGLFSDLKHQEGSLAARCHEDIRPLEGMTGDT